MNKDKKEDEGFTVKGVGMLLSVGVAMAITAVMGLAIGIYLDRTFDKAPWFMLIFLMVGLAAGVRNAYHMLKRYGITDD